MHYFFVEYPRTHRPRRPAAFVLLSLFVGTLLATGCGFRSSLSPEPRDAGVEPDGSVVPVDAGRDARASDAGDVPPREGLYPTLQCNLDASSALTAIARHVACTPVDRRARTTMKGLMEAWEAGLLSGLVGASTGLELGSGCAEWQCAATAGSCAELNDCIAEREPCESGTRCRGNQLETCHTVLSTGARYWGVGVDCSSLGGVCDVTDGLGRCDIGGCFIGPWDYHAIACDGNDLTLCDGAVRYPCDAEGPGAVCGSVAVSGEVPTYYCNTGGVERTAGVYASPVECADGVVTFESLTEETHRFDCIAAGYRGCDEAGCLE
jgi:hypothetical protein